MLKHELCDDGGDAHDSTCLKQSRRMRHLAKQLSPITDRDETVPLVCHGVDCRTQEKIRDPNPGSNDRTFPLSFKVTGRAILSVSMEILEQNAYCKSCFIPMGAMMVAKTLMTTRIASCKYSRPRLSISDAALDSTKRTDGR